MMKIYLAGKIHKNDWRHSIVAGLTNALTDTAFPLWPELPNAIFGHHTYVGPYFVGCDHGCYHGDNAHGSGLADTAPCGIGPVYQPEHIWQRCQMAIDHADVVFAWIESEDCYGTLVELGWAAAAGKQIWIAGPRRFPELWIAYRLAQKVAFQFKLADSALWQFLKPGPRLYTIEELMALHEERNP
jgi:hypothetical protein